MKSLRLTIALMALTSLPFGAIAAQGRGKDKPRAQSESECKPEHRAALERARAEGREAPPGLAAKCPDAPPPPPPSNEPPPSGPHTAKGVVYEDVDGNAHFDMFAGEMGIAGVTVQLSWNGRVIAESVSDENGQYQFPGLATNTSYIVCAVGPSGYSRSEPSSGTACGGAGYVLSIASTIETHVERNFGFMLLQ
ncbi:MAG TPA: SdrD B-like domain-containing protein [Gemmatimonadales bacterium]|nr:SdrD B-like domain-containing protein [Gemmatimonadales bacterium]